MDSDIKQNLRFNYIVNLLDGAFFGAGLGFASFNAIIPLFVATMTDSALLIGLIPAVHNMGWQLPQLLFAKRVSRLTRYKPITLLLTIHERVPFVGLAIIAWLVPVIGAVPCLILTYLMLIWQSVGGGFTANPWQMLIGRVIPSDYRATFFGLQAASINLFASGTALIAGLILERLTLPLNFSLCFFLAAFVMIFSWIALYLTREPERAVDEQTINLQPLWSRVLAILKQESAFRSFLITRILFQFGLMAFAFYAVYAVKHLQMSEATAATMISVLMITQVVANPILGWLADHWGRKNVLEAGAIFTAASAILAWLAPTSSWFIVVFILAGVASTAYSTISLAMTLEFGKEQDRPTYIGMANTLIAPFTILAPLAGGWLADALGFQFTFIAAAIAGLVTAGVLQLMVPFKISE